MDIIQNIMKVFYISCPIKKKIILYTVILEINIFYFYIYIKIILFINNIHLKELK